jgi:hypothetical protein
MSIWRSDTKAVTIAHGRGICNKCGTAQQVAYVRRIDFDHFLYLYKRVNLTKFYRVCSVCGFADIASLEEDRKLSRTHSSSYFGAYTVAILGGQIVAFVMSKFFK